MCLNIEDFCITYFSWYILAALFTNSVNTRSNLVCTVVLVAAVVTCGVAQHISLCSCMKHYDKQNSHCNVMRTACDD
jgi:hypothetical protein